MRNSQLNRTLARIEREANDDLQLILAIGASHFPTAELHLLFDQLEWRQFMASEELKAIYRQSILIPVVFGFVFFFSHFDLILPAVIAGALLIVLSVLLVWRSLAFHRRHPTYYYGRTIGHLICQELDRRRHWVENREV